MTSMDDRICNLAGWNRVNAGAIHKAHSDGVVVEGVDWDDVPDDARTIGGLTVWAGSGAACGRGVGWRLFAAVRNGLELSAVRDITLSIRRVE